VEEACPDRSDLRTIIAATWAFGMIGRYAGYLESSRNQMTEPLVRQVTDALEVDARAITDGERHRSAYYHRVRLFLQRYDYIVCPTVGAPAFRLDGPLPNEIGGMPVDRFYDVFLFTYAFSVTGLPAISVPCGFARDGLPVGLQIVGRRLREDAVLEAAAAYLQTLPAASGATARGCRRAPLSRPGPHLHRQGTRLDRTPGRAAVDRRVSAALGVGGSDQSKQPEQDDRPDERHAQAHEDAAASGRAEEAGEEPPSQEGTDDPDDDVPDKAESMAADDSAG